MLYILFMVNIDFFFMVCETLPNAIYFVFAEYDN